MVRWNPDTGETQVIAGDNSDPAQNPQDPYGIAFDAQGRVIISDKYRHRLCRVSDGRLEALEIKDVDGHRARKADSSSFFDPDRPYCPSSLFRESSGALLVAYYDDNTLYRVHPDGRLELLLGSPRFQGRSYPAFRHDVPPGELKSAMLRGPVGLVARRDGTMFFIERRVQCVREFHPERGLRSIFDVFQQPEWVHKTEAPPRGRLDAYYPVSPVSVVLDANETLHLCDNLHGSILRLSLEDRTFERVLACPRGPNSCLDGGPLALVFGPDGTAWVADSSTQRIQSYTVDSGGKWNPASSRLDRVGNQALWFIGGGMGLAVGP